MRKILDFITNIENQDFLANLTLIITSIIAIAVGIVFVMPVEDIFIIILGLFCMKVCGFLLVKNRSIVIILSLIASLLIIFYMSKEGTPYFAEERSFFFFVTSFCVSWIITLIFRDRDDDMMNPVDILIFIIYILGALCAALLSEFDKM